jgi:hypothetical protein
MSRWKEFNGIQENILSHADRVASQKKAEESEAKRVRELVLPEDFQAVPLEPLASDLSNFSQVFKPMLFMKSLYYPIFLDLAHVGDKIASGAEISLEELNERYLYIQHETEEGLMPFNPVYTDPRLFAPKTTYHAGDLLGVLEFFLYDPFSSGIAINPPSRAVEVAPEQVTFLSKDAIASLIGMLQCGGAEPPPGVPFHEYVLQADLEDELFQVVYFWGRSYRTPRTLDDCTLVYLEKLRACWELNYPGGRKKAANGLKWLMEYMGETQERAEVWEQWKRVLSVH